MATLMEGNSCTLNLDMTLVVKDEADIIEANILWHKAKGVRQFFVLDNNSKDGTYERLKELQARYPIYVWWSSETYDQEKFANFLLTEVLKHPSVSPDWIISNDADEFWWASTNELTRAFDQIECGIDAVRVRRHNMLPNLGEYGCRSNALETNIWRKRRSRNLLGTAWLPGKVAFRANEGIHVMKGSHQVQGVDKQIDSREIEIFHYPIRSPQHFERKLKNLTSGEKTGPVAQAVKAVFDEIGSMALIRRLLPPEQKLHRKLRGYHKDVRMRDAFKVLFEGEA